jgi:hypothetical protein
LENPAVDQDMVRFPIVFKRLAGRRRTAAGSISKAASLQQP